jgi:argininosuccinate lyase
MTDAKISRERLESAPGATYAETILEPAYAFQLDHYFGPLVETNKAWTLMLLDTGIIDRSNAAALVEAIAALETEGPDVIRQFNPAYEYFYSHVEHYLMQRVGAEVAGEINIGRTRPEPLARLVTRERLLEILSGLGALRGRLLEIAERSTRNPPPSATILSASPAPWNATSPA